MKSDLTSLMISCPAPRARAGHEKNRMSKAALVRGAFAIQCNSPALPVWLSVTACSHPCSHCHSTMEMTGTVHRSDLAKWRQDDVRCRRTIRRWKAWLVSFRSMCGAGCVEQKIFIHPVNSSKQTVVVTVARRTVVRSEP